MKEKEAMKREENLEEQTVNEKEDKVADEAAKHKPSALSPGA